MVEAREVVEHPRRHQQSAGDAGNGRPPQAELPHAAAAALLGRRPAGGHEAERDRDEGEQRDGLGAAHRRERDAQAHDRRRACRRPVPEPVDRPHRDARREHVHALRHEHLVVDPQVRVAGREQRREPTGPVVVEEPARDEADHEHGARAEQRRRQPVCELARTDEARDEREVDHVRGRVTRARRDAPEHHVLARVDEAVALGDEVRLPVVVGGVTVEEDAAPLVDHITDAPRERDGCDRAQPDPEPLRGRGGGDAGRGCCTRWAGARCRPRHDAGTYHRDIARRDPTRLRTAGVLAGVVAVSGP